MARQSIVFVGVVLALVVMATANQERRYFNQTLDHFQAATHHDGPIRRFLQKYYVDSTYWQGDGPIFLYINGEAPCNGVPDNYLRSYAQQFGGLMIALEHRFYGESQPFSSLSAENLRYLSSKQAIEDVATFIEYYNSYLAKQTGHDHALPWITVGCSYAGALSAWFRLKHPEATQGSLSSSGVVHAILDFTAFDEEVATAAGQQCADALRTMTAQLEFEMQRDREETLRMFKADFFEDDGDFYYMIADSSAETIQYGYHDEICNVVIPLRHQPEKLLEAYAEWVVQWWYPVFNGGLPISYSTSFQQREIPGNSARSWWWQKCSELAYFQNAPSVGSIRSHFVDMDYHRRHCHKVFNGTLLFPPNVAATNNYYGGDEISATRVYFANASQDPWQEASVVNSTRPATEPAGYMVCSNCGHCADLRGCPSLSSHHNETGCADMTDVDRVRADLSTHMAAWLALP